MNKDFFLSVQTRLKDKVSELKYIDENWGQLDFYGEKAPVKYPAALIDIGSINWINKSQKQQLGVGELIVTLYDMKLTRTSNAAPSAQKEAAFSIYSTLRKIHLALHGWVAENTTGSLVRVSNKRAVRDDGINEYATVFKFQMIDDFVTLFEITDPAPEFIIEDMP